MRLTIDLDTGGWLRCMILWSMFQYIYGRCYWRYSAKRGYHIKVHGLKPEEVMKWRQIYDDEARIRFDDECYMKPKQILWTEKDGHFAGYWRDKP
jgi:hypothetical protein